MEVITFNMLQRGSKLLNYLMIIKTDLNFNMTQYFFFYNYILLLFWGINPILGKVSWSLSAYLNKSKILNT